ncbi:linker for activation of T-cells family member 2 isoform X2 [Ahaetulla prasina]|uniref:linker for activation of T-cells family member 2 isoform X2 n=1 Tax=Ahaetulla prasina TaxID=499056 RepID=UPI002647ACC7|nr:linker for activation of T-cells family member 2 isoform X2 [Ahaetulla prasina]
MGQVELIWGAFSLMILGALITMCMKCQQTGSKQEKANVDNQRTQYEDQQDCDERSYLSSVSKQSQMKETYHTPKQSKSRKLNYNDIETNSKSRFQNITTEDDSQTEDNSTYVEPLSSHHDYNWQKVTGLSSDDDSHGYQNVIGTIKSNRLLADEDIYENNLAIQIWKQAQISESNSANCEEESIYINAEQYSRQYLSTCD